jgi:hypothetical protein
MVLERKMKIKLLGLLLIFAGVLYWQDSTSDDAMDKYIEEYKVFQAKADSVTELADSLKEEIVIADNESRAAESRAKVLSRQVNVLQNETLNMEERAEVMKETLLDTLELARQILPLKDSIIAKQKETIATQGTQITELESALQNKDNALRMALTRGDSLQAVINIIPPAPKNPNRMLGFKLPSRKASFLIGFGIGIGTSILVIK